MHFRFESAEIFAVFDEQHLVIANIASPTSAKNIQDNPNVCVSFIDVFTQKGCKVSGLAIDVANSAPGFNRWAEPLELLAGPRFPVRSVFVIKACAVVPILAPSYRLYPDETTEQSQVKAALRAYGVQLKDQSS